MLGFIYIVGFGDPQVVKVGMSREPLKRMRFMANTFNVKFDTCRTYVSSLQRNPFHIERMCHKALAKHSLGGYGPKKLYPKETFRCGINEAKAAVESVIAAYEKEHPRFNRVKMLNIEGL